MESQPPANINRTTKQTAWLLYATALALLLWGFLAVYIPAYRVRSLLKALKQVKEAGGVGDATIQSSLPRSWTATAARWKLKQYLWMFDTRVTEIRASHPTVNDEWLIRIRAFNSLTALNVEGSSVTDSGLIHCSPLSGLRALSLRNTVITGRGMAYLNCPDLRLLDVSGSKWSDAGMAQLYRFDLLSELQCSDTSITNLGLASLAGSRHHNLQEINLVRTSITGDGLTHLARLRGLTNIRLSTANISKALRGLPFLDTLYLDGDLPDERQCHYLPDCAELYFVNSPINDEALRVIANSHCGKSVTRISTDSPRLTDRGLLYLTNVAQLNAISSNGTQFTASGLAEMNSIRNGLGLAKIVFVDLE